MPAPYDVGMTQPVTFVPVTFGVEEEFLLADRESLRLVPAAADVLAALPPELGPLVKYEARATQVETATPVCDTLGELAESLATLRAAITKAAATVGCTPIAAGTAIQSEPGTFPLADAVRYADIAVGFGALVDPFGVCACHVHIGVPDRGLAVQVLNYIRGWLPVLQTLAV